MSYHSRHHKRTWKAIWQPTLIISLVLAAGGTSGWVVASQQQIPGKSSVAKNSATLQSVAPNAPVKAVGEYRTEQVLLKVTPKAENGADQVPDSAQPGVTPSNSVSSERLYTLSQLRHQGVINWHGYKFTYYSQKVLPGGGLRIPGRHVNADGYVADKDGYIVLANSAPKGTVIATPFGAPGKVYDRGTKGNHFDVYTS